MKHMKNPVACGDRRGARKFRSGEIVNSYSHSHTQTQEYIDPRLAFLARASARLALVEAGEMELAEAFGGLGLEVAQ